MRVAPGSGLKGFRFSRSAAPVVVLFPGYRFDVTVRVAGTVGVASGVGVDGNLMLQSTAQSIPHPVHGKDHR